MRGEWFLPGRSLLSYVQDGEGIQERAIRLTAYGYSDIVQVKGDPRCKICNSPYRAEVDQMLAAGIAQSKIIAAMNTKGMNFNKSNMHTHKAKHLVFKTPDGKHPNVVPYRKST